MRLGNHVMTSVVAALVLEFNWPEVPLVVAGTCFPFLLEKVYRKYSRLAHAGERSAHAIFLWISLLVITAAMVPALHIGETIIRPWAMMVGALIHVFFDLLGGEETPVLPTRERPRVALRLYRPRDILSEDTFVWLFMAAGVFVWLLKN